MRENNWSDPPDSLAFQALLYAGGELEGVEAAAFERRLGEEQAARDALGHAVQMTLALAGRAPVVPDAGYRGVVRQRLRQRRGVWDRLAGKRSYRGHPAVWSGLGAAAAVLLLVVLGQAFPAATPATSLEQQQAAADGTPEAPEVAPTIEMAKLWADLSNNDHLERVRSEEARRKTRLARGEESRSRLFTQPMSRN